MPAKICPDRDTLFAFQTGALPEAAADTVIAHLGDCNTCQTALSQLNAREDPPTP